MWVTPVALVLCLAFASDAQANAPPGAPLSESPADASQAIAAFPQLCVEVTDPDGDALSTTFWGRRLTAEDFTIISLPDTQYYTRDNPSIYYSQTDWIVANRELRNIVFTTHLGDLVQTGSNNSQWNVAENAMSTLEDPIETGNPDGMAYGAAPGNHDQAPLGAPRSGSNEGGTTQNYNSRFGVSRFSGREYYGGNYDFGDPAMYSNNNDNNFEFFSAGGMEFMVAHLEYDAVDSPQRDAVLSWLDNLLMLHEEKRAIVTSHYVLHPLGVFSNQGQAIYDTIKDNRNAFFMTGGHVTEANNRSDTFQGITIHTVLSDYQNRFAGGNGWLRINTFRPELDRIEIETYSPWLDQFDTGPLHQFTLEYEMHGGLPYRYVGRTVGVPSGGTACVPWSGRRSGERYEWYVEVSDGVAVTTGPVWKFGSDGTCGTNVDCSDIDPCTEDLCQSGVCAAPIAYDGDADAVCGNFDNCPRRFNAAQADLDGDEIGDLCDVCPENVDPSQSDGDDDAAGNACDCQPLDGGDRQPALIDTLIVERTGETTNLMWGGSLGSDAYSVTRGDVSLLAAGDLGDCLTEGLLAGSADDADAVPLGSAYYYLVQGQNFDCGLGALGYDSDEVIRVNESALACSGWAHSDGQATSETAVSGTVIGTFSDTTTSDDAWQTITEEETKGNPANRYSELEHRWTVSVTSGRVVELHVEGFRDASIDGDDFAFEYSTDGGASWLPIGLVSLPTADNGTDLIGDLPPSLSGSVQFRVIDTNRVAGNIALDSVNIDQLFVRTIP